MDLGMSILHKETIENVRIVKMSTEILEATHAVYENCSIKP